MNEVTGIEFLWVFLGGIFSGFLNTLASSGSAVSLPLLVFVGFTPTMANATNRMGILSGAVTSTWMFYKDGLLQPKEALRTCASPWLGALIGAMLAVHITNRATEETIFVAVILAFILIFVGAKRFLRPPVGPAKSPGWRDHLLLFAVGIWAGFIVLDSATYLLLVLVLCLNLDLKQANAYKSACLLGIAVVSMVVFGAHDELNLVGGITLAIGNIFGAWAGAKAAVIPGADKWVYRLLVSVVSVELMKLGYGIFVA